jgi:hypothetical protein
VQERDAQRVEQVTRNQHGGQFFGQSITTVVILRAWKVRRGALEDRGLLTQIFQFEHREPPLFFASKRRDANQAVGVTVGQGAQQERVDETEDRRVRADAQRQC